MSNRTRTAPKPAPPSKKTRSLAPEYRKGDVWLVASDPENPSVGTEIWSNRPAVVVSADMLNRRAGFCQVVYLTNSTSKRSGPTHVPVPSHDGRGDSLALCEQIHSVDCSRMRRKLGYIPGPQMRDIDSGLAMALSLGIPAGANGLLRKWEDYIKTQDIDIRKEIDALSAKTADDRVEALTRALQAVTTERDAYRALHEAAVERPEAMDRVATALSTAPQRKGDM